MIHRRLDSGELPDVAGLNTIRVGNEERAVRKGDVIFVPAGALHQTIASATEDLEYLLYNTFLDDEREGHATFADHIRHVKATRRSQADAAANAASGETKP